MKLFGFALLGLVLTASGANIAEPLLIAGSDRAALVAPCGKVVWEKKGCGNIHRVFERSGKVYYSNGAVWRTDIVDGKTELLFKPAEKEGVWGFDLVGNGNIVAAVNATDEVVELTPDGKKEVVRFKVNVKSAKGETPILHHHLRMIRKTNKGTYLVCCSLGKMVREYDKKGTLLWEQEIPNLAFDCLRLKNGNTLVSHLDAITEYTPDHKVAWSFACSEAPAEMHLKNLCGLQEMNNGNIVVGTYANGTKDRQNTTAFEVTRAKKIVWDYKGEDGSMMTAFRMPDWHWPIAIYPATPAEEAQLTANAKACRYAVPKKARKVLVLARSHGYGHVQAMGHGSMAFAAAAREGKAFDVTLSNDLTLLQDPAKLAPYDAIVLNNCTSLSAKRYPGLEKTVCDYVAGGKGIVFIHSSVDAFYDSPAIQELSGGLFFGHPWMAGDTYAFVNEEPGHPVNAAFAGEANPFLRSDEIYMQASPPYNRKTCRVLLSLDATHAQVQKSCKFWSNLASVKDRFPVRKDKDFAVSWIRRYGEGRVFHTSFGHDKRAFLDGVRFAHMMAGLQYVIGDLEAGDTPRP